MLAKNQSGGDQRTEHYRQGRRVTGRPKKINQQGYRRRSGERGKGNVPPKEKHQHEKDERTHRRERTEGQKYADACRDTFAAFESEPHREAMADESRESCQHHRGAALAGESRREPYGRSAFAGIQEQGENAGNRSGDARHIGSSNIAAAVLPYVFSAHQLGQQQAKRNRSKQIAYGPYDPHCNGIRHEGLGSRDKRERLNGSVLRSAAFEFAFDEVKFLSGERAEFAREVGFHGGTQRRW